jgi:hypothetical protein
VVSKSVFGGTVYVAPRHLRGSGAANRLRVFARVRGLVTDGTFFPDGKHVLLRTYGTASVYTFPSFGPVGTVDLPAQRQGEGISVSPRGRVLLSSEGVRADVLQVTLPGRLTRPAATASATPLAPTPAAPTEQARPPARTAEDWGWIALVATAVGAVGYLSLRGARLRSPRRP